ncbi:NAD-dependent epimerase/dehydratase family protein [Butyrivibrio sp. AE2032]|uniref:NAD-dependent epimerase/dehydratase family protein n=1 Tax=Butyrivibrio sp. AE2032 TaxID=1458463 RepID=UPI000553F536|nr:NAD-dependent epimerase/dehydratase family protein [Butyrivibrio sp. AE2032]
MGSIIDNSLYLEDVKYVANLDLPWDKLKDKSVLLSGATGLIGSFLVDVIMLRNREYGMNTRIVALGRKEETVRERFPYCFDEEWFEFIKQDLNEPVVLSDQMKASFVLHLASNTHPLQYSTDPIGTIMTNVIGTKSMLDVAVSCGAERFLLASSNEIYGENRGDVELFYESYCGYIDCNTLRAGYPEGKRCAEALCQAYISAKGLDAVIARLTRSYGPTMKMTDSKALSQFIKKGLDGEDIVLKSEGTQYYSYSYVADSVSGLLTVLLKGETGGAYNIADEKSDVRLKELAGAIAQHVGKEVIFELPDAVEAAGYSKATKARLDGSKLKTLGWSMKYDIIEGIARTMEILRG